MKERFNEQYKERINREQNHVSLITKGSQKLVEKSGIIIKKKI